jgi:pimeloyl-ACP methyl ester carboxylesterase
MSEDIIHSKVPSSTVAGNYASVNGLNLYYETYGSAGSAGVPLVLLHGGLGVTGMFAHLLPELSKTRPVVAVELQAHGHTADIVRPLSFEGMADDIAGLIQHLGLEHADVMGYSLGGGVALQTVIRHPEAVRKLVVISATCRRDGWYPEVLVGMAAMNAEAARSWVGSPMHAAYASVAPRPEDWPTLADKLGQLLKQDYDWSKDVAAIRAPTLIVIGDADSVRTAHAVEMFELLGGGKADAGLDGSGMSNSRLAILPATTHFNILFSPMLASAVPPFLDAPVREAR